MSKKNISSILMFILLHGLFITTCGAQKIAVKTNLLYGATTTPNLQLETGVGKKTTLELGVGFNFFQYGNNAKLKHLLVQPEFRYWFSEKFNRKFIGLHAHAGIYNVGNINVPLGRLHIFKDNRYEGHFYGAGVSFGNQWQVGKRWNVEASLGGGYARIHYKKFDCGTCGIARDEGNADYLGITKASLSMIYFIK